MKILILSDSHNGVSAVNKAVLTENDTDVIFHAGDYAKDIRLADTAGKTVYAVRGNCDGAAFDAEEELITLEGIRFFLTHGYKYRVKYELSAVTEAGRNKNADAVIFGHTHIPLCVNSEGMLLINPGTVSGARTGRQTYAVIITDGKGDIVKAEIREL